VANQTTDRLFENGYLAPERRTEQKQQVPGASGFGFNDQKRGVTGLQESFQPIRRMPFPHFERPHSNVDELVTARD
jgi:hypothetical protein